MSQSASNNYLLYQAHGSLEFKNEALSSILSYLLLKKQTGTVSATILVYTDEAKYFQQILGEVSGVKYIEITAAQLRVWRGDIDFVHRIKVELLRHALTRFGGNILYLDSDTYFLKDDTSLFQAIQSGQHFMHVQEGVLSQTKVLLHQNLYRFLRMHFAPEWADVSSSTAMYNAGAIGLNEQNIYLVDKVLHLTDTLYKQSPSHVVEQFAFSYCLQQAELVNEAIPYILHYWHMKDARMVLDTFFTQKAGLPLEELLREFAKVPMLAAAQTKFAWEARSRWQRGIYRFFGYSWKWPHRV
ncbi:MAG: hypothetical protein EOO61_03805 [Hymenobacter sp.]|nr:MAG: hypothetical protein EOO61_03805 [Hymenobacter sp.]